MKLSPTEIYKGRNIFIIGSTGFLGKVTLSMLLHRFPNVGRVYVTVRARSQEESETRFWNNVITAPPFDPLRERYGGAFEGFIRDKVEVVGGDIGEDNLGYTEEEAQRIADDIDVVLNSAGNVTFNPTLESALRTNVVGTQNVIKFARRMKRPALIHVSTCFVAGNRTGPIWESDPVIGYFPRREEPEMAGVEFSAEHEIRDCAKLAERVREEARDAMNVARFRELARKRLIEEGRDPDDLDAMGLAVARERKVWTRTRLTDLGIERAAYWGWPNIYTYTKSLGEQLVAAQDDIVRSIVRPSIVESALSYPFPGWNEGFTTTAPIIFITLKGQTKIPANEKLILDITPVDQVAAVMLAVSAQACVEEPRLVHQAATGDSNPNDMRRIISLVGLYKRKHFQEKETGIKFINEIVARTEARPVTPQWFDKSSTPMINNAAKKVSTLLDRARPRWGGGRLTDVIDRAKERMDRLEEVTRETVEAFDMFHPFTVQNAYIFRADNVRSLFSRIRKDEQPLLLWNPEKFDWYDYWMHTHLPGLKKWVFPTLEDEMREKPKRVYTYRDLLELFETTTKRHATRVAMRIEREGRKEQYTYADLRELSLRAAAFLASEGVQPGMRVMLLSHNAPEWGMTYFGILKAGATCIPVDPTSSTEEVVRVAEAGDATGIVISEEMSREHPELEEMLKEAGLDEMKVWQYEEVFALPDQQTEDQRLALLPQKVHAQSTASLIFTSGTTGQPKGVMLSHRNFTSMVSMLSSIFDMSTSDGVLSVLPLHHTFEFSTGFLTPLSRGAQITYLDELSGEALARAIKNGHVTGMVGVPALWEMLHRRIKNRLNERNAWVGSIADLLIRGNAWLRDKTPLNLGQIVFYPIHEGMGGRIRYLISGGSALSDKVQRDLHGLGFTVLEGYGLTEASPVLTVTRPQNQLLIGSVGKPLPGVEVRIADPDSTGVGEVLARGPNIMTGYFENEEATRATIVNRWLYTGDLGRMDEDGNLYLVGRSKDIIVDTNGKNVYPDEIEELYNTSPLIKELSVVGLPDGIGEKVACMVVPDYDYDIALSREELRRQIEEHFREVSSSIPFFKRVKVLHFWDGELPRTATRKVKRREVVEAMQVLEESARSASRLGPRPAQTGDATWLLDVVATVSNRQRSEITFNTRLADLGFDSLMYVELATAIENAGGVLSSPDTLTEVQDLRELAQVVTRKTRAQAERRASTQAEQQPASREEEIYIPSLVRTVGNKGLDVLQRVFYERFMHARYEGTGNIPPHTNFIVAPNHVSHLDMGLAKMALGEAGREMVALAAADYFFDNKYKRAYMDNFTNLVPMERSGSLRQSLRHAKWYLDQGYNALIFPEGTRSMTGEMAEFKPVIGYLALASRVGILPIYLWGTYEAMPKGSNIIRSRDVGARIGRYLSIEELEEMTKGMARAEAYRLIAALVRHEVENLRDGTRHKFDAPALKKRMRSERRAHAQEREVEERQGGERLVSTGD
ncbi:MAG: AMP-binding protein [Pyrinomonadaceae bacterium]|nr:AMP-binding protein [Pyrinomonadaceae bacterium]